jgi:hypothetical protein
VKARIVGFNLDAYLSSLKQRIEKWYWNWKDEMFFVGIMLYVGFSALSFFALIVLLASVF